MEVNDLFWPLLILFIGLFFPLSLIALYGDGGGNEEMQVTNIANSACVLINSKLFCPATQIVVEAKAKTKGEATQNAN